MSRNNPRTVENLREKIRQKAAESTPANSEYNRGYLNGWISAVYWADEIDRATEQALLNEVTAAFERAVTKDNAADLVGAH